MVIWRTNTGGDTIETHKRYKTRFRLLGIVFLLVAIALSSWIRIHTTLADPNFLTDRPEGMMRSDPGLLFYMLERVVEYKGLPPPDFRSDPRVEHPLKTDLPALDSVSQEFPIAWAYLLAGSGVPLHVFCLWFMSIFASIAVVGVYFLALELTDKVRWACLASALFVLMEANYRTIGFLLMREDFSLPFFALHLALFARAARLRTVPSMLICALSLTIALASWHAMGFVVSLEFLCLFLWYLGSGENPFEVQRSWTGPAFVAVLSLCIPLLTRTGYLLAPPMRMVAGLLAAAFLKRRGSGRIAAGAAAVGTVVAVSLIQMALAARGGGAHYSHVWELLLAKVRYLGDIPADPNLLSFDARAMWQGPFVNMRFGVWPRFFGTALWLFLPALVFTAWDRIRKGEGHSPECLLDLFAAVGLASTWLVARVMPIPGMLLPVCVVLLLRRIPTRRVGVAVMGAAILWQGVAFGLVLRDYRVIWYQPSYLIQSYRDLLAALPALVPENEAVMADPVVSTAILAHTRRPIILQPKWEEEEARVRLRDFTLTFFHGSPEELRRLLLRKYRCRYLLVDRYTLWEDMRYIAGIPLDQPYLEPGTAAAVFLGIDSMALSSVAGYRLLYRSPGTILDEKRQPTDTMRLYELAGLPGDGASP